MADGLSRTPQPAFPSPHNEELLEPRRSRLNFLDLPAELRLQVYDAVLDDLLKRSRTFRGSIRLMRQSQSSLYYVNRQIRREIVLHFRHHYLGLPML